MQRLATKPTLFGRRRLPDVIGLGGAVAGLLAGAVMVLISPLLSLLNGVTIWYPPRLIAATVLGAAATQDTGFAVGPVLTGFVIHMLTSIVLGTLFGIVTHRILHLTTDFGLPIYVGLCYGLIVFFIARFVILPYLNPQLSSFATPALIAQNVIFGMCLGICYILVRPEPFTNTVEAS